MPWNIVSPIEHSYGTECYACLPCFLSIFFRFDSYCTSTLSSSIDISLIHRHWICLAHMCLQICCVIEREMELIIIQGWNTLLRLNIIHLRASWSLQICCVGQEHHLHCSNTKLFSLFFHNDSKFTKAFRFTTDLKETHQPVSTRLLLRNRH